MGLALWAALASAQPDPGDVRFHWVNPTQNTDGTPLDLNDVVRVQVEWGTCAAGAFTKLGEFYKNGTPVEPWVDVPLISIGLLESNCERARLITTHEALYEAFAKIERVELTPPPRPRAPTELTVEGKP